MLAKIFQSFVLLNLITLTSFGNDSSILNFKEGNALICSNITILSQPMYFFQNTILIRSRGTLSLANDLYIENSLLYIGKGGKLEFSPGIKLIFISPWTIVDDNFNIKVSSSDPIEQLQEYLQKLDVELTLEVVNF